MIFVLSVVGKTMKFKMILLTFVVVQIRNLLMNTKLSLLLVVKRIKTINGVTLGNKVYV